MIVRRIFDQPRRNDAFRRLGTASRSDIGIVTIRKNRSINVDVSLMLLFFFFFNLYRMIDDRTLVSNLFLRTNRIRLLLWCDLPTPFV